MSEHRFYLFGPNSGGVVMLVWQGDRVKHEYGGDEVPMEPGPEEELLADFLARGANPPFLGDATSAIAVIRASLDGSYTLVGPYAIRCDKGVPVEIERRVRCENESVGGHRCSLACAPAATGEHAAVEEKAARLVGRALDVGPWRVDGEYERAVIRLPA